MSKFTQLIAGMSLALSMLLVGGSAMANQGHSGKQMGKQIGKMQVQSQFFGSQQQMVRQYRLMGKACVGKSCESGSQQSHRSYRYYRHEFRKGGTYRRDVQSGRQDYRARRDNYRYFDRGQRGQRVR